MDAMKNRARAFAEGIVVMVCPVLLAITFQKVDFKTKAHRFVWGICPIAAITLESCLFPFLFLLASKNLDLVVLFPRLSRWLFGTSKLLIHLCALLQMFLAFGFLFLINRKNLWYLIYLIPFMALTVWRCYWTVQNDAITDGTLYQECEGVLERSLDFSSVVTAILFLGLEGLALEGHSNGAKGLEHLLAAALGSSFMTCVGGVFIMLLGTVPILIADSGYESRSSELAGVACVHTTAGFSHGGCICDSERRWLRLPAAFCTGTG